MEVKMLTHFKISQIAASLDAWVNFKRVSNTVGYIKLPYI